MSKAVPKITPMMAQNNAIKAQCPDALVMMRLGDFYVMVAAAFDGTARANYAIG